MKIRMEFRYSEILHSYALEYVVFNDEWIVEVTQTHYMSQEQVDSLKEMIEKAEKVKADLESVCEV